MGAILAFCIGNAVQNEAAQLFRWCGEWGIRTNTMWHHCGHSSSYVGGSVRRKLIMGTQRADRRTWIMMDPKEGKIGRILSLLSGRNGDKTCLMARLKTTPWSRKKQEMVWKEKLGEPPCAPEKELAPAGQPAAHGGEEQSAASRRSNDGTWPSCVGWSSSWEMKLMSLVCGMTKERESVV